MAGAGPPVPRLRRRHGAEAREVGRREALRRGAVARHVGDLLGRARGQQQPAELARAGPEVDHKVGRLDHLAVVLDHEHRVAQVAERGERGDQLGVVARVQPDARLVEHVQHARQLGADLGRQADPLRLAARERPRGAVQRQVVQADVQQEVQPLADLLDDGRADGALAALQVEVLEPLAERAEIHLHEVGDGRVALVRPRIADTVAQRLGLEAPAVAHLARAEAHERFAPRPLRLRRRVVERVLDVPVDAAVAVLIGHLAALVRVDDVELLVARAVQDDRLVGLGQVLEWGVVVEPVDLSDGAELAEDPHVTRRAEGRERALADRLLGVRDHQVRVDLAAHAEPVARRAGAVRAVEAERVGRGVVVAQPIGQRGQVPREQAITRRQLGLVAAPVDLRDERAAAHAERDLGGLRHARPDALLHDQPVDDDLDVVDLVPVELHPLRDLHDLAVRADALEAGLGRLLEQVAVVALPAADDRREDLHARALRECRDRVDDLVVRLTLHRRARDVRVGVGGAGVEQPHEVVDLRHRAHRRARVAGDRLLLDGDHRREAVDEVDVGPLHHPEKLAGVARQRLHVAALALGVDRVEGQARFAGPAQARHHDELVAGDVEVDALEVVLAGTADKDAVVHSGGGGADSGEPAGGGAVPSGACAEVRTAGAPVVSPRPPRSFLIRAEAGRLSARP